MRPRNLIDSTLRAPVTANVKVFTVAKALLVDV
jgi:hypothetical protein